MIAARTIFPKRAIALTSEGFIESSGCRTLTIARGDGVARVEKKYFAPAI
jgi:hypothetical protein